MINKETLFIKAATKGHLNIIKNLVDEGINIECLSAHNNTALILASS